eukprot:m51a1_g14300 hypothetical protein (85) ;mRNA; f:439323-440615
MVQYGLYYRDVPLAEHGLRLHSVVRVNSEGVFGVAPEQPLPLANLPLKDMISAMIGGVKFPTNLGAQDSCGAVLTTGAAGVHSQ